MIVSEHRAPRPFAQTRPHLTDENQQAVLEVSDLQQLPDQHRPQYRADAARRRDERIRGEHERVQPRKENVRCSNASVTNTLTSCSNGR